MPRKQKRRLVAPTAVSGPMTRGVPAQFSSSVAPQTQSRPSMSVSAQPAGSSTSPAPSLPGSSAEVIQQILAGPGTPNFDASRDPKQLFAQAMNQANAANDQRYKQAVGLMAGQGASSKYDVQRARDEGFGADTQSLIDRGLYNTTTLDASRRRRDEELNRANQSIDESVADRTAGIVERRTDQAPDMGVFASLLQQEAAAKAQDTAQSQKTSSTIFGPRGPNSFTEGALAGGAAGGGGGSGGSGGGRVGTTTSGGGGGAGGASGGTRVGSYFNPNATPGQLIHVVPQTEEPKRDQYGNIIRSIFGSAGTRRI